MIHSDVSGPMHEPSLGGIHYYITFIDDATAYRFVYFIKNKADVVGRFIVFEKHLRNKFGRPLKGLRSDNGREYVNERLTNYLQSDGIIHEGSALYTPEQNGKAKRENRSIIELLGHS